MKIKSRYLGWALSASLTAIALPSMAQSYQVLTLDSLSLGGSMSMATGVNNAGQVVGVSSDAAGNSIPVIWNGATPTVLAGGSGVAQAINNNGQVAGFLFSSSGLASSAVVWNSGVPTTLDPLSGGSATYAYGINDAGQVAGQSDTTGGSMPAVIWNGTTPTSLGGASSGLIPFPASAFGINSAGQAVGMSSASNADVAHATVWNGTTPTLLAAINGSDTHGSVAMSINDAGQAAGYYADTQDVYHAAIWSNGVATELAGLNGLSGRAFSINNHGQVVGSIDAGDTNSIGLAAALWDASTGAVIDLNSYLSASQIGAGIVLIMADGISDGGFIVGQYYNTLTGDSGAFKLLPVPEPGTYALFLMGLGGLALVARRRRAAA